MINSRKEYKKNISYKIIEDKINKVDGAMAQEGMPLTNELKQRLYNCIIKIANTLAIYLLLLLLRLSTRPATATPSAVQLTPSVI